MKRRDFFKSAGVTAVVGATSPAAFLAPKRLELPTLLISVAGGRLTAESQRFVSFVLTQSLFVEKVGTIKRESLER